MEVPLAGQGGRRCRNQGRLSTNIVEARLEMGARIASFFDRRRVVGHRKWRVVAEEEFNLAYSPTLAQKLRRAHKEWHCHAQDGALTSFAAGAETRLARRRTRNTPAQLKMPALGFELLQWFVDEIVALECRADARLLLDRARQLREMLLHAGVDASELPVVDKHWLFRWRRRYNISYRAITARFKVSFAKALHRVGVMLGNIFRLRKLWSLCHGDTPMRWLSMGQKPSWFNNAGLKGTYCQKGSRKVTTKTDHNATRQRYTVLTFVQSWPSTPDNPPKCAILFKASSDARRLRAALHAPPGMLLQFQERGSYRTADVVEALDWALEDAARPQDSVVVLLDWFSAHLSDSVQQLIRDKGHILLHHGGGVTGAEQVNDTHLHALVQRKMEELETVAQYNQRRDDPSKIARLSRQNVIDIVREMWLSIDHNHLSALGYQQTGPTLPDGATLDSLYKDLQPFWEKLDGDQLRRDAAAQVQQMWDEGLISSWSDAEMLIEHHAPHPPVEEGLEGVPWDIAPGGDGDDDDAGDGSGGGDDDEGGEGGGDGDDGDEGGRAREKEPMADAGGDVHREVPWGGLCHDARFIDALKVVEEVAKRTRDDKLLRLIRERQRQSTAKQHAMAQPIADALREQARTDRERELKRRAEQRELERKAAREDVDAKRALADAQREVAHAQKAALESSRVLRREEELRRSQALRQRSDARWLQTKYPVALATTLLEWCRNLPPHEDAALRAAVTNLSHTSRCQRNVQMPVFWEPCPSLTCTIGHELGFGGVRRAVRCCKDFEWLLFRNGWAADSRNDASCMLVKLLDRILPQGSTLFRQRHTVQVMMNATDNILEMTFVFAVVLLSKWLGPDRFPHGVFAWPPPIPA